MHALIIEDSYLIGAAIELGLRDLGYTSFDLVAYEDEATPELAPVTAAVLLAHLLFFCLKPVSPRG